MNYTRKRNGRFARKMSEQERRKKLGIVFAFGVFLSLIVANQHTAQPLPVEHGVFDIKAIEEAQAREYTEEDLCGLDTVVCEGEDTEPIQEVSIEDYIRAEARKHGLNPDIVSKISWCESRHNPLAENHNNKNGSNDKGLFQINSIHNVPDNCRLDAKCSTEWAMKKMVAQGYQPWYSSEHCWNK